MLIIGGVLLAGGAAAYFLTRNRDKSSAEGKVGWAYPAKDVNGFAQLRQGRAHDPFNEANYSNCCGG